MKSNTKTMKNYVAPRTGVLKSKSSDLTHEGGLGYLRSAKSELFLLGAGSLFGENSYYESGNDSASRFKTLVAKVTKSDPDWVASFLKWLRNDGNIRTAAIVGAVEYVRAGGPNGRSLVKSVIVRGDEPAEMIAYYLANYGRRLPQPIKRGIRDSVERLYNERNFAKWDSGSAAVRMADVIELTHPRPSAQWQSDLFKYAIEHRHGRATFEGKSLASLEARSNCSSRKDYIAELGKGNPTITWENVSSAGKGRMTAEEWLSCYEYMGYMAKLRNLRNLDLAPVSIKDKRKIGAWLADPENVKKSRQLPLRFYSAYKEVGDDVWRGYLEEALETSLANVPVLNGKWLVLVDASGSMGGYKGSYYSTASLFGAAFAKANNADLRTFSNGLSPKVPIAGKNVLRIVQDMAKSPYWMGMGTSTASCLKRAFGEGSYDGVVIVTDEQYGFYSGDPGTVIPWNVPLYTFNIAGYKSGHEMTENRVTVGGLSDAAFTMIATIESGKAKWPWE